MKPRQALKRREQHSRQKKASRESSESRRLQLRQQQIQKQKTQPSKHSISLPTSQWLPQLHFRPDMGQVEVWSTIQKLDPVRGSQELVVTQQLDYVAKGLEASNLVLQRACLAILCEATKTEPGCAQMLPHVPLLQRMAADWSKYGLEISTGCLGVIGNIAVENSLLRDRLLPCLQALSRLILPSTPDVILQRLMQLLADASSRDFCKQLVPIVMPVILRTIDKKDDAMVLEKMLTMFKSLVSFLDPADRDRFLMEHEAAFVSKVLPYYRQGCRQAVLAIEELSMGEQGLILHRVGYSAAAFSILVDQKAAETLRCCAAVLLNNLFANEQAASLLWKVPDLVPTILHLFVSDGSVKVKSECSDVLHVALCDEQAPVKVLIEKHQLLPTLAASLSRESDPSLLKNAVDVLDYLYDSPCYRANLFEDELFCKAMETGLERLEKWPDPEVSSKATGLLEKIECLEHENAEEVEND